MKRDAAAVYPENPSLSPLPRTKVTTDFDKIRNVAEACLKQRELYCISVKVYYNGSRNSHVQE